MTSRGIVRSPVGMETEGLLFESESHLTGRKEWACVEVAASLTWSYMKETVPAHCNYRPGPSSATLTTDMASFSNRLGLFGLDKHRNVLYERSACTFHSGCWPCSLAVYTNYFIILCLWYTFFVKWKESKKSFDCKLRTMHPKWQRDLPENCLCSYHWINIQDPRLRNCETNWTDQYWLAKIPANIINCVDVVSKI